MKLVAGERKVVGPQPAVTGHVHFHLAGRLHGVAVIEHATRAANPGNLLHREQHAGLVVRPHQRHDGGFIRDRVFQVRQLQQPVPVHRQIRHPEAVLLQRHAIVQHRRMFHRRRDDVPLAGIGLERRMNRRIVALRRARRKNHVARLRPDQFRHLHPRRLDHRFQLGPKLVAAGRIAPLLREVRTHGLENFRQHRRRRIVVQINHARILPPAHPRRKTRRWMLRKLPKIRIRAKDNSTPHPGPLSTLPVLTSSGLRPPSPHPMRRREIEFERENAFGTRTSDFGLPATRPTSRRRPRKRCCNEPGCFVRIGQTQPDPTKERKLSLFDHRPVFST